MAAIDRRTSADRPRTPAICLKADQVIIVPGYGMAVAQARMCCATWLTCSKKGCSRQICNSPGCWQNAGTYEVLLAEANVPYDEVLSLRT